MSGENWSWDAEDASESIVIARVDAVAVYQNTNGDLVIRQQHPLGDDDAVVIVPRAHVPALLQGIKTEMDLV
ncbi:hypothetical protein LMG26788_03753 [Achromobacter pulmonis]|uniref:Uncharacterized protein n=1 Tax=Achromobacter pulmonis TaxID=1389932 RepID=A0A6S7DGL7_9BURK|nr:hypothetical protein [Achromobacter pulmonis]CAB3889233.1 hypothetical protein LMG26788_03687 [Achromobacter pulmonis]CAB3890557.1 hypothetical protein LMG26788_03753 [Achromobacter pulmonis]